MPRIPVIVLHRQGAIARAKRVAFGVLGPAWEARYHRVTNSLSAFVYSTWPSEMPRSIELETISLCNGGCTFCPVNFRDDPRPTQVMSMELIQKIARELEESDFGGDLALFSNNEPTLDKRIVEIAEIFRKRVPRAWIYLYTNGTRLTAELYLALFDAGMSEMIINNYNDGLELNRPVNRLLEAMADRKGALAERAAGRTTIFVRRESEVLLNRGGTAPNKKDSDFYLAFGRASCGLPFHQMVIRPAGGVSLCCQDALGKVTLGDIANESIRSVWNGEAYRRVRSTLQRRGRHALPLCDHCDAHLLNTDLLRRMMRGRGGA